MGTKNLTRWDEDGSLLRRMRRGDVAAFEEVRAVIDVPLFSYALRFVRNRAEAEDIVQKTFLRLYRAARTGKLKTSPRAYAFSIAHNLAADAKRREKRIVPFEASSVPAASRGAERSLLREQVDRALAELPQDHRSALLLREFGELSYAEIAETLDASLGQVKVWIHRARRRLGEIMDRDGQYVGDRQDGT